MPELAPLAGILLLLAWLLLAALLLAGFLLTRILVLLAWFLLAWFLIGIVHSGSPLLNEFSSTASPANWLREHRPPRRF
jgi:hypothetical protein